MTITAAADGSALGNPGPAGWAWFIDDDNWAAGGWRHATNNQGELKAVLELFRATAHVDDDLLVLCDSQYVINSVTKWMPGWKKKGWRKGDGKPVLNLELLREIDAAILGRRYRFEWVRGHVGHPLNEAADSRARAVAEAFQRGLPVPEGLGFVAGNGGSHAAVPQAARATAGATGVDPEDAPSRTTEPKSSARAAAASGRAAPDVSLFDFDSHELTVTLTDEEFARLFARARQWGVTVEDALRRLI